MRKRQETVRDYDSVRRTTCCNCPTGCGMKVFLKGDEVVDIFGDEEHPVNKGSLCPKGLLPYWHLRNPERIVHPQMRERLDLPYRRVTWDEAISFTSQKLTEIALEYGKDSLFVHGDESAPFEYLAGGDLFTRNFPTRNGPYRFLPYPFGYEGSIKRMFGVPASQLSMNTMRDWCNSRCIIIYRSDLAASDPITFGHIVDDRDRGSALLVIDSRNTVTSSKSTISLRVRPGTEPSVLKGIIHILIRKGLLEEDFLEENVEGLPSLIPATEDFSPERVAACAGIGKADIERAADIIGKTRPVQLIAADWNSRRYLSDEELFLCGALVSLRGSVGIPGGGLNLMDVSPFPSEVLSPGEDEISKSGLPVSSLSLEHILLSPKKAGALIWRGNPCARMAGGKAARNALREVPLIVHLSSYPNESYHYSHVSFPMSSWLEYPGLVTNNNGRAVQWHHKIAEPPGECRSPLEFWNELAHSCDAEKGAFFRLGHGRDYAVEFADIFLKRNPLTRGMSVEKLDPERNSPGGLLWPCIAESDLEFENSRFIRGDIRGRNILFQRAQLYPLSDKRFPTSEGKIIFHPRTAGGGKHPGSSPAEDCMPRFRSAHDDNFPMIMVTGLLVDFVEEYGYFVSDRNGLKTRLIVKVHPQVGKLLGVKNGQNLIVENERGSVTAPVWLSEDVEPGVVWCPEGLDPYQPLYDSESPRSLFDISPLYSEEESFTRVRAYRSGRDKMKAARELAAFLEKSGFKTQGLIQ
jgi:anaerobic selenocysteine-containing dehydrogenase